MSKPGIVAVLAVVSITLIASACKPAASTTVGTTSTTTASTVSATTTTTPARSTTVAATTTSVAPSTTIAPTTTSAAPSPTSAPAIDARAIFAANCAPCHGINRQGVSGLGPALTPASLGAKTDAQIKDTIAKGKAGTAMQGFEGRLTAGQIEALARYVKTVAP